MIGAVGEFDTERAAHHTYSVGQIALGVNLVLSGANGLRTAARSLAVMQETLKLPWTTPSWYSGRLWLMRIGHYKLHRPKTLAKDWIWIVDFSIQQGKEKCLVILGIRQCDLPPAGQSLRHQDMEPIALVPVTQANGAVVWQRLNEAVVKTGVPRAIVSDRGTDLNAGIQRFCAAHSEVVAIYDIKHKVARMLKHRLERDARWESFTDYANRLKKQLQQTEHSHLTPPALRTKARYMNLAERLGWAQKALVRLDAEGEGSPLKAPLGGLEAYRPAITEWAEMYRVAAHVEHFVSTQALCRESPVELALRLRQESPLKHPRNRQFRYELLRFVRDQVALCRPQERLPGSSEVLESVFGKQKRLEGEQAKSGFTGLLLALPAIVAELNTHLVRQALESTPVKAVLEWKARWLGDTLQARRKQAFSRFDPDADPAAATS